ncbi:Protein ABSCISIC ACID-INSENSITIVE 5 [Platanthera zijinensis]|uniref:Protein ABSCISIC ACID-INSENSITIVE 5 n=1 Tax=Platanthera zijinensis TaxID=2320716 RepID=A0AAP0B092_9ASPA
MGVSFPLARQSSIYSRTLDQIQNTVCEPGKNFGSMNMDELLTNLWTVEESGFISAASAAAIPAHPAAGSAPPNRQSSIAGLPSPLCRKTVEEVWAEIHFEKQQGRQRRHKAGAANCESTFGEMTLEDFLIKAGVVREGYGHPTAQSPQPTAGSFGHVYGAGAVLNERREDLNYSYTGVEDGSGGNGGLQLAGVSSDGMGDSGGVLLDGIGSGGGRKRLADGAGEVGIGEVVVERRQRRMIKNRESAARSRARKQAYTVELEAELNHLKEENARLREEERSMRQIRKQMVLEAMAKQACSKGEKCSGALRTCNSSPS